MKIKFFLHNKNADETSVLAIIRYHGRRYQISIGEKVRTKFWNQATHRLKYHYSYKESAVINVSLDSWELLLNEALNYFSKSILRPDERTFKRKVEEIRYKMHEAAGINVSDKTVYFTDFLESYIKTIERKPNTIKRYNTTLNLLKKFQGRSKLTFDDIDLEFYNSLQGWMNRKKYSLNYFGDMIKNVKLFMAEAKELGYHKQDNFRSRKFKFVSEETDAIYLTVDELIRIHRMQITEELIINKKGTGIMNVKGNLERKINALNDSKDRFLIGAFSGLRFSDYGAISGIRSIDKLITKRTAKTGVKVVIPMHWVIKEILERRENILPPGISNQKLNEALKEIGFLAGIDDDFEVTMTTGGRRETKTYKKYQLITTHTARRSACTNMYLQGIDVLTIMGFSGHRTIKSFMKYIRVKQEENAKRYIEHQFFLK